MRGELLAVAPHPRNAARPVRNGRRDAFFLGGAAGKGSEMSGSGKTAEAFPVFDAEGRIRPVPAELDPFAFFGLSRRLGLDEAALEAKYYGLSRRLHPDFFTNAPAAERVRSLDATARLNEAYRILKDPIRRSVCLVELEIGKMEENSATPPADLLEQILETQEDVAELKCCNGDDEPDGIRGRLLAGKECFEALRAGQRAEMEKLSAKWDAAFDAGDPPPGEVVEKMRSLLSLRKYIENVLRSVEDALKVSA